MDTPEQLVVRCQQVMAHAWMVRTFVKHSSEGEDFPELLEVARMIFDLSLALEPRLTQPAAYFKMLGKKLHKLRKAVEQFAIDAPVASTHTNFVMAVVSSRACCEELERLLPIGLELSKGERPA